MRNAASKRNALRSDQPAWGFTLIELLVVVAIIALLISILLPSLNMARDQSKMVKCLANSRSLGQAAMAFATEHQDRFQLASDQQGATTSDPGKSRYAYDSDGELLSWITALARYAGNPDIRQNRDWGVRANDLTEALARKSRMNTQLKIATCPADRVGVSTPFYPNSSQLLGNDGPGNLYWGFLSYGINEDVAGAQDSSSTFPPVGRFDLDVPAPDGARPWRKGQLSPRAGDRLAGRMSAISDPATVLLFADAGADSPDAVVADPANPYTAPEAVANLIISAKAWGPLLSHAQDTWPRRVPIGRHQGGAVSVTFADFHGERVAPTGWAKSSAAPTLKIPRGHNRDVRVSPYPMGGVLRPVGL